MLSLFIILVSLAGTNAHLGAVARGMYCQNGTTGTLNLNSDAFVEPMYQLPFEKWWFHGVNGCDKVPPPDGEFLELPAGGQFIAELVDNQAHSTLSYGGKHATQWVNGATYDESNPYNYKDLLRTTGSPCISNPNMHTQNQSRAAGTAFAISYVSDISQVTMDNLVVFSVAYNSPWQRVTTYEVPAKMPPCPAGGCICAFVWIPNGCGLANSYMGGFKCKVTNSISNTPLAAPKPPVWCEDSPSNCTKGAKQILAWHQLTGTNIEVEGFDLAGDHKSPGYNGKCGFANGAQNDIFEGDANNVNVVNSPPKTTTAPPKTTTTPQKTTPQKTTPHKAPPHKAPHKAHKAHSGSSCNSNSHKRWADDDTNIVRKSPRQLSNHRWQLLKSRLEW